MLGLLNFFRQLGRHFKRLSWGLVMLVLALHCLSSYTLMLAAHEDKLVNPVAMGNWRCSCRKPTPAAGLRHFG